MENYLIISISIIISFIAFLAGLAAMAKYKNDNQPVMEKQPTRDTVYGAQVINVAAMIYCNYNETKIIRLGATKTPSKSTQERQGQALQEALNLVGAAYKYFDIKDSEPVKKPVDLNIN